jgi:chromosome segregation ATPase
MSTDTESELRYDYALSVAHDLLDTVVGLKAELKLLAGRLDQNAQSATLIIQERENQIQALIDECSRRDDRIAGLEQRLGEKNGFSSDLEEQFNRVHRELQNAKDEIEAHKKSIGDLKAHINTASEQHQEDLNKLAHEKDQAIDWLKDALDKAEKSKEELKDALTKAEKKIDELTPVKVTTKKKK